MIFIHGNVLKVLFVAIISGDGAVVVEAAFTY